MSEAPQIATPAEDGINGVTEAQAFDAIFENKPITIAFSIGEGERAKKLELKIMWPDGDDESEIASLAADFLGIRPEFGLTNDMARVRGRAVIEQLACTPYPSWLPLGDKVVVWRGKERKQPHTGGLKSPAIPVAFYYAYAEVINRFHSLAAG